MDALGKQQILDAQDLAIERVDVPEWGGAVVIRGLTGLERDAFEAEIVRRDGEDTQLNLENLRAKLLSRCIIDEKTGDRLFSDSEAAALGKKSGLVITRLFEVAQRLSGLSKKDVEALAQNLPGAQSAGSTSV